MTDLTPVLNELLKGHDAQPTVDPSLSLKHIDEFLKEAYRINSHIASLNRYLRNIRQSYLSTAPPPRRNYSTAKAASQPPHLSDRQKEEVDAETKQLLRELNASIRTLADAEQLRQNTEATLTRKRYARLGLGALGAWAAGSDGDRDAAKSAEQRDDEARANAINTHRESVLWYLRRRLQECGTFQAAMMEKRIMREVEKSRSVLAKSRGGAGAAERAAYGEASSPPPPAAAPTTYPGAAGAQVEEQHHQQYHPEEELTPEQIQMFERENQDMLKHYESTLDQVRTAEKSLLEISELQTQLVGNLATQSAHIDQLVADSLSTTENVGGGNKQLKKAAERKSTAKYVFYASCSLSLFLVVWDLVI